MTAGARDGHALSSTDSGVVTALSTLRQKRRAAEALYDSDCPAEALRMSREALQAVEAVARAAQASNAAAVSSADASCEATLRACGVREGTVTDFRTLGSTLANPSATTDETVKPQDAQQLQVALRVCREIESVLLDLGRPPRQRLGLRIARVALPLGLALLSATLLWLVVLERERWSKVSASATFNNLTDSHGPQNVTDHLPETEWLAADHSRAWVEFALPERRDVRAVVLRNGHNPPFNDRACESYRVELYRGDTLLAHQRGRFAAIETSPAPVTLAFQADGVERVRVVILGFHGLGAALAEVEVR